MGKVFTEVKEALKNYKHSDIIAFPTDTVYGVGADPFNEEAVKKIYNTKNRPDNKPLAILCADKEQILKIAKRIPTDAGKLIDAYLPGPLTVILPKRDELPGYVTSGLDTVGVRIPDDPRALAILAEIGPLAVTSANISGSESLVDVNDVIKDLGDKIDIIVSGIITDGGLPSTVVALEGDEVKLIREGAITKADIEKVLK